MNNTLKNYCKCFRLKAARYYALRETWKVGKQEECLRDLNELFKDIMFIDKSGRSKKCLTIEKKLKYCSDYLKLKR